MPLSSIMDIDGQIVVPLEVRTRLGLSEGDRVEFIIEDHEVVFRKVEADKNTFVEDIGAAPAFGTLDEINAWIRVMRDE